MAAEFYMGKDLPVGNVSRKRWQKGFVQLGVIPDSSEVEDFWVLL
jgi:hypothetical protein